MSTATLTSPAIAEFAANVRAALNDLPADEIEDLTDGLEADLEEQANDFDTLSLGDPVAYAQELRASAGLPARTQSRAHPLLGFVEWWSGVTQHAADRIRSHPLASRAWDFALAIRPVWWILRGWALSRIVVGLTGGGDSWAALPNTFLGYLVLFALLVISIQWGRGKWAPRAWLRAVRAAASIVAILLIPVFMGEVGSYLASANYSADTYGIDQSQGLQMNGTTVTNIFAYDANGQPLKDVQLFDQNGNPLNAVADPLNTQWVYLDDGQHVLVPNESAPGRVGWNVFPLGALPNTMVHDQRPDGLAYDPSLIPNPATPPFAQVQPLSRSN